MAPPTSQTGKGSWPFRSVLLLLVLSRHRLEVERGTGRESIHGRVQTALVQITSRTVSSSRHLVQTSIFLPWAEPLPACCLSRCSGAAPLHLPGPEPISCWELRLPLLRTGWAPSCQPAHHRSIVDCAGMLLTFQGWWRLSS